MLNNTVTENEECTVAQPDEGYVDGSFIGTSQYISDRKRHLRIYALGSKLNGDLEHDSSIIDADYVAHQPEDRKMSSMNEEDRQRARTRILRRIWREQKKKESALKEK
jgi:hypothetical protein